MLLGAALAAGLIVGMQVPLLHPQSRGHLDLTNLQLAGGATAPVDWPATGTAAVIIPSLGVAEGWHDHVVPIASLTKMMTAYVTLAHLPLALGGTGPCVFINDADVALANYMKSDGQSYVEVAVGERLCEIDLLGGLLVHSANNFALILATMVAGTPERFVALMNSTATQLGLLHTHYVEPSGYKAGSVSTALEQGRLAVILMRSALVRSIVAMASITLPVAGTVDSFTPYVGTNDVVGVKSGRTLAAGGCVVMAMTFAQGASTQTLYAVVLGQRGGDVLSAAGDAALALANSARDNQVLQVFTRGVAVGTIGWGTRRTSVVIARTQAIWRWAGTSHLPVRLHLRHFDSIIHRGEVVGWLGVLGASEHRLALVAKGSASPPTMLQRLR